MEILPRWPIQDSSIKINDRRTICCFSNVNVSILKVHPKT